MRLKELTLPLLCLTNPNASVWRANSEDDFDKAFATPRADALVVRLSSGLGILGHGPGRGGLPMAIRVSHQLHRR
jgi:hypothetical protein